MYTHRVFNHLRSSIYCAESIVSEVNNAAECSLIIM